MARLAGPEKEFMEQLGAIAASKMSKEAAEQIAQDLEQAKQYAAELKKTAHAEVQESEQLRDKNRRQAREITDKAKAEAASKQTRLDAQKQQIRLSQSNLEDREAALAQRSHTLDSQVKAIAVQQAEANDTMARALKIQTEAKVAKDDVQARLEETVRLWQHSL